MKPKNLRKKSDKELNDILEGLKTSQIKASSEWARDMITKREAGINIKGMERPGRKTSLQKDIRRNIARVKTIINERRIISNLQI